MNQEIENFLNREFLENTYRDYILFGCIILLALVFKFFISKLLSRLLFRMFSRFSNQHHGDDFVVLLRKPVELFFLLLILIVAFNQLKYPDAWHLSDTNRYGVKTLVNRLTEMGLILCVTWMILRVVDFFALVHTQRRTGTGRSAAEIQVITFGKEFSKILVIILSVFFILGSVFGVNVASLLAGLGIGGLAIALAAQETIANLIGSFVIFLDKPFEVGDYIKTDKFAGNVEQIGFRSTRIRTADRSLLIVPNKVVAGELLNNITRSTSRRVRMLVRLSYDTAPEKIKQIIKDIEEAIAQHGQTYENYFVTLDNFAETSIQLEVIFFTMTNDGDVMQRIKQDINFRIIEIIEKNGASFAIPTSAVYLHSPENGVKDGV